MTIERIIGIDFGTSTSYVKVKRYENGQPWGNDRYEAKAITFGGDGNIACPTVIQKADDNTWFGVDAEIRKPNGKIYRNFKIDLENKDPEKRTFARQLTEEFFGFLYENYKAQSQFIGPGSDVEKTLVSFPAKWSEETRRFMVAAAQKAGFQNVFGKDEASAAINAVMILQKEDLKKIGALTGNHPLSLLLIDMGAGTTDLALCKYTPGAESRTEILSVWPKADNSILFGGREIDAVMGGFLADQLQQNGVPQNIINSFAEKRAPEIKSWKEHTVSETLNRNKHVEYCDMLNQTYDLLEITPQPFPKFYRDDFQVILKEYLPKFVSLVNGCLEDAQKTVSGFSGGDSVVLAVITGGHCQWYFVRDILTGKLQSSGQVHLPHLMNHEERVLQLVRPQETVSLGLVYDLLREEAQASHSRNTKPLPPLPPQPPAVERPAAPPAQAAPAVKAASIADPCAQVFETDHFIEKVTLSADGKFIVAGEFISKKVMIWNTQTGTVNSITVDDSFLFPSVKGLAISLDGNFLITGSNDYKARVWDFKTLECKNTFAGNRLLDQDSSFYDMALDPSGNYLITGDLIHNLQVWNWKTGTLVKNFTNQKKGVNSVAISPKGKWLVSGACDKSVAVRELPSYNIVYSINNQSGDVISVSISDNNETLAFVTSDDKLSIYDTKDWRLLHTNKTLNPVKTIAVSRDGKYVFHQSSSDGKIAMREAQTFKLVHEFSGHTDTIADLKVSADNRWLISGSQDKTVRMWKIDCI